MIKNEIELRDIPGYPGYRASADGHVYGRYGKIEPIFTETAENIQKLRKGKPVDFTNRVRIGERGKQRLVSVAELVCLAFHGPQPENTELHWKNGCDDNDQAENLCWLSLDATKGREIPGYKNYRVLLKDDSVAILGRYGEMKMHEKGDEEEYDWRVEIRGQFISVANLVCRAFHGAPQRGQVTVHIDGNTNNLMPNNLQWGTPRDAKLAINRRHSGFNDLTIEDRMKIWDMAAGKSGFKRHHPHDIAVEFECSDEVILGIVFKDRPEPPKEG